MWFSILRCHFGIKITIQVKPNEKMSLLSPSKFINQIDTDIVFGFIRNEQKLIKPKTIPIEISHLCLLYFYVYDYFVECGDRMKISEDNHTVEISQAPAFLYSAAYGYLDIVRTSYCPPMIYVWTYKILNKHSEAVIDIGIDSSDKADLNESFCGLKNGCVSYKFTSTGIVYNGNFGGIPFELGGVFNKVIW